MSEYVIYVIDTENDMVMVVTRNLYDENIKIIGCKKSFYEYDNLELTISNILNNPMYNVDDELHFLNNKSLLIDHTTENYNLMNNEFNKWFVKMKT